MCIQRAGLRSLPAAAAIVALAVLAVGAPVAQAGDSSPHEPRAEVVLPRGSNAHHPLGTSGDLPAQEVPTPDDEIPDVSLTLGGASHTVDVAGYFTDSVNEFGVAASPSNTVRTSRSGTVITIEPLAVGSVTVTVTGKKPGGRERKRFTVTVSAMVAAPTATGSIAAVTLTEGATHDEDASDYFEGEGVTYTAESSDEGVATVEVAGLAVTVTAIEVGGATVTVTATNTAGSAEQSFAVTVLPPAPTATGSIEAATISEGDTHEVIASDYFAGEGVTYGAESSDAGVATVAVDGVAVTVTAVAAGSATVTVTATNTAGSAEQSFAVTVQLPPVTLTLGGAAQVIELSDQFGSGVTGYDVSVSPAGVVDASTSGSQLTLTALAVGAATVTLGVTSAGDRAEHQFAVSVAPAAPTTTGSISALTLSEREAHALTASDYFVGESVTYEAESSDSAVAAVAVDGATVTVTAVAVGEATVTITATNAGGEAEQAFAVSVQLPVVTLVKGGAAKQIELADYFGQEVTAYEVAVSPNGIVHVSRSGSQLTLTGAEVGNATVTVTATSAGGSAEQSFAVTVLPPAPTATGSIEAATLSEGETHEVTASEYFSGEGVTYAAGSSDAGVASVAVDGAAVTVTAVAAGSATVTVTATNSGGSAEQSFAVTVQLPPVTLTLGGAAQVIELSDQFGSGVTGYDVSVSPAGVVDASTSGSQLTLTALAVGAATVTLGVTSAGDRAEHQFSVSVTPAAPTTTGSISGLTLSEREAHALTASDYFVGESVTYEAESSDSAVAAVAVDGATVTVTAVAVGEATVTITATNAGGEAEQAFAVSVQLPVVTLVKGGAAKQIELADYFGQEVTAYEVAVSPNGIVHVSRSGSQLTLTGAEVGNATVTVTATSAGGSAEQSFAVTVLPPAPTATGSIEAATLSEGETHEVTASEYFSGEGVTYAAGSSDAGVASVAVDGAAVTVTAVAAGSATVTVTATNSGGSAEQSFAVTVQLPPVTLTLGGAAQVIELSDQFGSGVTGYDVSVSPAGVVDASTSGSQLTLTALAVGAATVTLGVTSAGDRAEHQFSVSVTPAAPTTTGSISGLTLSEREAHALTASDYFVGESVTYEAESSDSAVAAVAVDGATVTVTAVAVGEATVTITATNAGGEAEQAFAVSVQLPVVTLVKGGAAKQIELADYFGQEVTAYEVAVSPNGIVHVSRSGSQLTLTGAEVGNATVTVTATNSGGSAEQSFAVTVLPPAPAAVGSIEAATISEGETHLVTASDYFSGEGVTYAAESSDAGVASVEVSGAAVTVTAVAAGSATVTVTAANAGGSAEQSFAVTVLPPAPVTVGSIEAATISEGDTHSVTASDYFAGDGVTYAAGSSDSEVASVEVNGEAVTVTAVAAGSATVTVTAANAGGSAEQSFAVTVLPPAPTATGSIEAATLSEGDTHSVTASDYFAGEGVTYAAGSSDAGVASVAVDGATVTVTALAAGSATVTVTAANTGGSAEQSFAVTVLPPAPATVGSIEAVTISEGETHEVIASEYFGGEGVTYAAGSSDPGVASVAVDGATVTVTALAAGSATVTVTADELRRERGAVLRGHGAAARAGHGRQHRGGDAQRGRYPPGDRLGVLQRRGDHLRGGVLGRRGRLGGRERRGSDGDGDRGRWRDGDGDCDELRRERGAIVRRDGDAARAGHGRQHPVADAQRGRRRARDRSGPLLQRLGRALRRRSNSRRHRAPLGVRWAADPHSAGCRQRDGDGDGDERGREHREHLLRHREVAFTACVGRDPAYEDHRGRHPPRGGGGPLRRRGRDVHGALLGRRGRHGRGVWRCRRGHGGRRRVHPDHVDRDGRDPKRSARHPDDRVASCTEGAARCCRRGAGRGRGRLSDQTRGLPRRETRALPGNGGSRAVSCTSGSPANGWR